MTNRTEREGEADVLRNDIDHTRAELGETVNELAARMDVPARAKAAYGRASTRVRHSQRELMIAGGAVGAVVAGLVLLMVLRRRRQ